MTNNEYGNLGPAFLRGGQKPGIAAQDTQPQDTLGGQYWMLRIYRTDG